MFKKTRICTGLALAFGSGLFVGVTPAIAQDAAQRVEITGSSVRRIDAEAALPVQVVTKEDIARSGATSTTDLLQRLPAMQGATGESTGVGPDTKGFTGVSIHNIGETRTLVLLNGHRLAQFGGQTLTGSEAAFDLNSIPVSALDRVEILTDGASALYGSDAIAGVVNFITKRNTTDGDLMLGYSAPKDGAKETRFSIGKGFGTQEKDGFNAFLTYSHLERTKLDSASRDFAKTGRIFFSQNGKQYRIQQFSPSPIPANALDDAGNLISPIQKTTGSCPAKTFRVIDGSDDYCGFDFVGELEIYPVRKTDNGIANITKTIGDHELFADLLLSQSTQVSRLAPVPGSLSIPAGSALFDKYLAPLGITQDTSAFYRLYDMGKRTNDDKSRFLDLALGSRGLFSGWDYNAAYTHSQSDVKGNISGYPGAKALSRLRASGLLDPFVGPGQQTAEAQAAINAANYSGYWDGGTSTLDTVSARGSREIATLPAGALMLGTGANFNSEKFDAKPSLFAQGLLADPVAGTLCDPANPATCDQRFGDSSATPPYSASRKSYGLFGELVIPVVKNLEANAAVRYDHYSDFGSATTGKASFKWTPASNVLVRGSFGSGFHAPTVPQTSASLRSYGVTSNKYTCTPDLKTVADSLGVLCQPGSRQYDQLAGGNKALEPEKSQQGTLGIRFEPIAAISLGADYWVVNIRNSFGQLPEGAVFGSPLSYPNSWGSQTDVGTGKTYLAFKAVNQNLGEYKASGIDFDFSGKAKTGWGDYTSQFGMTYMLKEDQQLEKSGQFYSAIGQYDANLGSVTFKYQGRWTNTLKTGNWTNSLMVNFKSGYDDQLNTVDVLDSSGNITGTEDIRLKIKDYYTFDWQTVWDFRKDMGLTVGALNLFDKKPPLSISSGGLNQGQQFGYDDRYYDSRGRTLYANFNYRF